MKAKAQSSEKKPCEYVRGAAMMRSWGMVTICITETLSTLKQMAALKHRHWGGSHNEQEANSGMCRHKFLLTHSGSQLLSIGKPNGKKLADQN